MTATEKAGSNSDVTNDRSGITSCGNARGIDPMSPTVGTMSKPAVQGRAGRLSTASRMVAAAMAMMKAKRCNDFTHSSSTISPSVKAPTMLTHQSIRLKRSKRSNA